jgi:hypothetical protein
MLPVGRDGSAANLREKSHHPTPSDGRNACSALADDFGVLVRTRDAQFVYAVVHDVQVAVTEVHAQQVGISRPELRIHTSTMSPATDNAFPQKADLPLRSDLGWCALGGIRTHTGWFLRPWSLPLDYQGARTTVPSAPGQSTAGKDALRGSIRQSGQ